MLVHTNNIDGLIPGTLHWSRYMGDRQFGFLGFRPVADILLKLDAFCEPYQFPEGQGSALEAMAETLARHYRDLGRDGVVTFHRELE